MPISGLVVTLDALAEHDPGARARTLAALGSFHALELGELLAGRLPAVLVADDYAAHDAGLDSLRATPGVAWVDVVFHDFSDIQDFERPPRRCGSGADAHSDDGGTHGPA